MKIKLIFIFFILIYSLFITCVGHSNKKLNKIDLVYSPTNELVNSFNFDEDVLIKDSKLYLSSRAMDSIRKIETIGAGGFHFLISHQNDLCKINIYSKSAAFIKTDCPLVVFDRKIEHFINYQIFGLIQLNNSNFECGKSCLNVVKKLVVSK